MKRELDVDLQTLNDLIGHTEDFSIVCDSGIFHIRNGNRELMRLLLEERKVVMAQQITAYREELQWKLI